MRLLIIGTDLCTISGSLHGANNRYEQTTIFVIERLKVVINTILSIFPESKLLQDVDLHLKFPEWLLNEVIQDNIILTYTKEV